MRPGLRILFLAASGTFLPTAGRAAEYLQTQGQAQLRLEAGKVADDLVTIRLSDALPLTLRIEGPATLEVAEVTAPVSADDWDIRPGSVPGRISLANRRVRWEQTFRLYPKRAGALTLTTTPLRFREE